MFQTRFWWIFNLLTPLDIFQCHPILPFEERPKLELSCILYSHKFQEIMDNC